jgi:hypothetical protein
MFEVERIEIIEEREHGLARIAWPVATRHRPLF